MEDSPKNRFTEQEREQLRVIARVIERSREHLATFQDIPIEELPLDDHERNILQDYRNQLGAVCTAFEQLMDSRLERSPDADAEVQRLFHAYNRFCTLQEEMAGIGERLLQGGVGPQVG